MDELNELLEHSGYSKGDILIFVGDLCAKGPKSTEVVQFARRENAYAVCGNHEYYIIHDSGPNKAGTEHYELAENLEHDDIRWLRNLPFTLTLEEYNVRIVHSGPDPALRSSLKENLYAYTHIRGINPDNYDATFKNDEYSPWAKLWGAKERGEHGPYTTPHVVFGHDAYRGLQQERFATGLDTGCVYGKHLSALLLPTQKIYQVRAHHEYQIPGGGYRLRRKLDEVLAISEQPREFSQSQLIKDIPHRIISHFGARASQ